MTVKMNRIDLIQFGKDQNSIIELDPETAYIKRVNDRDAIIDYPMCGQMFFLSKCSEKPILNAENYFLYFKVESEYFALNYELDYDDAVSLARSILSLRNIEIKELATIEKPHLN